MAFTYRRDLSAPLSNEQMDGNLDEIETLHDAAATAATAAQAAANFKGAWNLLTGALAIPASASHSGSIWMLDADVADVTSVEPGVTGWTQINNGDVFGPASSTDRAVMVADGVTGKAVIGTLVYIDASGNVGIGTASPARLLHISSGTVATAVRFESSRTDGGGSYIDLKDGNTTADFKVGIGCDADGAIIRAGGNPRVSVLSDGKTGIGTTTPTEKLDIDSDAMRLRTAKTPASAAAAGNPGTIAWDSDYIYVCVATNTWKRAGLATW